MDWIRGGGKDPKDNDGGKDKNKDNDGKDDEGGKGPAKVYEHVGVGVGREGSRRT